MAASAPHTITLRGDPIASEARAKASENIKPGMLVELHSDGSLKKHSLAGGRGSSAFAREMDIAGGSIDDVYEDGDTVLYSIFRPGDWVYGFLAAGSDVGIGALLESDGVGALRSADAASGARATLTVGAGNAAVKFDAVGAGVAGNDITIEVVAATAATATVTVTDRAIVIKPNSTTPGTTDTAATVVTLINGDAQARALVVASNPGTGASAIVSPVAAQNLAGGADTTGHPVVKALEAVDNNPGVGGAAVRIKVEVL